VTEISKVIYDESTSIKDIRKADTNRKECKDPIYFQEFISSRINYCRNIYDEKSLYAEENYDNNSKISSYAKLLADSLMKLEILDIPVKKFLHVIPGLEITKDGKISEYQFILYNYVRFYQINLNGQSKPNETEDSIIESLKSLTKPEEFEIFFNILWPTLFAQRLTTESLSDHDDHSVQIITFLKSTSKILGRYYNRHKILGNPRYEMQRLILTRFILEAFDILFCKLGICPVDFM